MLDDGGFDPTGDITLALRDGQVVAVDPGTLVRFGRSSIVELPVGRQPEDRLISRTAGFVDRRASRLRLANTSTSGKPLRLVPEDRAPLTLAAGTVWTVPGGTTVIELLGRVQTWVLELFVPSAPLPAPQADPGTQPATDPIVRLTDDERDALAAVCAPLLRIPPLTQPNGYAAAAALLPGVSAKAIERRLDKLAERMVVAGTPGLAQGRWRLGSLAQLAVDHGLVLSADVDLLEARRHSPPGSPATSQGNVTK